MLIFLATLAGTALGAILFMRLPKFGRLPRGERLERIKRSPHYRKGSFHNLRYTPGLTEGATFWSVLREFIFGRSSRSRPVNGIPSVKTDLHNLDPRQNVLVWFGHSSYFIQVDGKRFLVDPVLGGSASPLPGGTKAFKGSDIYSTDDMPEIDHLLITHDHWDHLDHKTVKTLEPKIKKVICGLGVGEHFERWGYRKEKIVEKDWNEAEVLGNGFVLHTTSARHFSGRTFRRNSSLWMSFVLKTPSMKIFIGGDSGYDTHFSDIGREFGPFDLAVLENGQYNENWRYIHTLPGEFLKVAAELNAKRILPVHNSKFVLSLHDWDEPLELVTKHNEALRLNIITPRIGEAVDLRDPGQRFEKWWRNVR